MSRQLRKIERRQAKLVVNALAEGEGCDKLTAEQIRSFIHQYTNEFLARGCNPDRLRQALGLVLVEVAEGQDRTLSETVYELTKLWGRR